jgi:sRNA-binding carbon storage regulator CsrA
MKDEDQMWLGTLTLLIRPGDKVKVGEHITVSILDKGDQYHNNGRYYRPARITISAPRNIPVHRVPRMEEE